MSHTASSVPASLRAGAVALGLKLDDSQLERLTAYLDLLQRWNKAYNLTAIRDRNAMITKHLLDSLAIASHIEGQRFIDVGTGAGLPGIPLAIIYPERFFTLLDSNGKKTRFLFQVKTQLGLGNVDIANARVEQFVPAVPPDAVLTRAFADLGDTTHWCGGLLPSGAKLYAMKAQQVEQELDGLDDRFKLHDVVDLEVPGLNEPRVLVRLERR